MAMSQTFYHNIENYDKLFVLFVECNLHPKNALQFCYWHALISIMYDPVSFQYMKDMIVDITCNMLNNISCLKHISSAL